MAKPGLNVKCSMNECIVHAKLGNIKGNVEIVKFDMILHFGKLDKKSLN